MNPTTIESSTDRNYWCDCIRGYAILIVCFAHLFYVEPCAARFGFLTHYFKGDTGVFMFYVLSGFLVTGILAREVANQTGGRPRLRAVGHFFARRIFRLQPSNLVFLGCYALLPAQENALAWWMVLLPFSNWFGGPYITWHLKTLHVEETYYAFMGVVTCIFGNRLKALLWVMLIVSPLGRAGLFILIKQGNESAGWLLDRYLPVEAFAVGGLLTLYLSQIKAGRWGQIIARRPTLSFSVAMIALLLAGALRPVKPFSYFLLFTWPMFFSICSLVMILSGLEKERFVFSARWLHSLGLMSYTVYLFQQFVLGPWSDTYGVNYSWKLWGLLVAALCVAIPLWYRYVEKPLTGLGSRMFPRIKSVVPVSIYNNMPELMVKPRD